MKHRIGLTAGVALALACVGTTAHAVPSPDRVVPAVATCEDRAGEPFQVLNVGAVGFVLDDEGEPTGEQLFLVELDAQLIDEVTGQPLVTIERTWGNRTGHGEQISCTGTVDDVPGATGVFTMVVTRR